MAPAPAGTSPSAKNMTLLEAVLASLCSAIIASATTAFAGNQRLNKRLTDVELKVAERYVSKEDLNISFAKFEEHLVRIESKFDTLLLNTKNVREN